MLADRLARLTTLSPAELRGEWLRVMKQPAPPAFTTDLLRRALAYRVQEQAQGGLAPALRLDLERLGAASERTQPVVLPTARIKPGTRLVRTGAARATMSSSSPTASAIAIRATARSRRSQS